MDKEANYRISNSHNGAFGSGYMKPVLALTRVYI